GVMKHWEVLKLIKDLQAYLLTLPGVTSSISLVDYLELLEAGLSKSGGADIVVDESGHIVPPEAKKTFWEDPASLAPVLSMVSTSPTTFKSIVTQDRKSTRLNSSH